MCNLKIYDNEDEGTPWNWLMEAWSDDKDSSQRWWLADEGLGLEWVGRGIRGWFQGTWTPQSAPGETLSRGPVDTQHSTAFTSNDIWKVWLINSMNDYKLK